MAARGALQVLRERIGHEATDALSTMMNKSTRSMVEEVVRTIGDRFERRLGEEVSTLRVETHDGLGALRIEMHDGLGALRIEMHENLGALRVEMHQGFGELRAAIAVGQESSIRWMFLFWVSQIGAIGGLLAYLK